jgi:hypothetical protein
MCNDQLKSDNWLNIFECSLLQASSFRRATTAESVLLDDKSLLKAESLPKEIATDDLSEVLLTSHVGQLVGSLYCTLALNTETRKLTSDSDQ